MNNSEDFFLLLNFFWVFKLAQVNSFLLTGCLTIVLPQFDEWTSKMSSEHFWPLHNFAVFRKLLLKISWNVFWEFNFTISALFYCNLRRHLKLRTVRTRNNRNWNFEFWLTEFFKYQVQVIEKPRHSYFFIKLT